MYNRFARSKSLILSILVVPVMLLVGCSSPPPSAGPVRFDELQLRIRTQSSVPKAEMPTRVHIFPPLRSDKNGKPDQSYKAVDLPDGSIEWHPPDQRSAQWLADLRLFLTNKGYEVVSFRELTLATEPHSILVINTYYSRPYRIGKGWQTAYSVFVGTQGATYPVDLDPAGRRELFNQVATGFFFDEADYPVVPPRTLRAMVEAIGTNRLRKQRISLRE